MSQEQSKQVLRLPKRHTREHGAEPDPALGARLVDAQSLPAAIMASLVTVLVFSVAWAMLSTALGRVFPWMTVVQGLIIGLAVRRAGRGLDWRFPAIAAVMALLGALAGNVIVAAAFTAADFETGTLTVLRAVTGFTWPVFFDEVMTAADAVYAFVAAAVAAYYANPRLTRDQYAGYRAWRETGADER